MGNLLDKIKEAGRKFDKAVIQPAVKGVKDPLGQFQKNTGRVVSETGEFFDENIGRPVTGVVKDVKRATGFETTPTPEGVKPKVDPSKAAAMSEYGRMVTGQAGQFDPTQYGPNTFQPRTFTPTQTAAPVQMPGTYQPGQVPGAPAKLSATSITPTGVVATPVNTVGTVQAPTAPGMMNAPQTPQKTTTPQLQNVSAVPLGMQNYNQQVDTSQEQAAVRQELSRLSNPMQLQSGYDPKMRQTYVDMATSGLQQQKEQALAQLKEEQMKAGNYGSSVGQKAMADLAAQFDRQVTEAGKQADMMQMEAEREDRYRNLSAEQARSGMVLNTAGAGANLNLSSQGFSRDTTSLQNQAEALKAEYARQGIQIDNATAMQMAEFSSGQYQQDFANRMAQTGMTNQNIQQMFQNQMSSAGFNVQQAQQQFVNEMTRAGFTSDEAQKLFQNQMTGLNFNAGQQQQGFQNEMTAAQMREAGQMAGYESDWRRYAAGQDEARYTDALRNQAGLFNIGQADTADVRNYGVFQDAMRGLATYGSDQIDPASRINYELWLKEQQDKNARLGATINAVGTVAGAALGSRRPQDTQRML